MLNGRKFRQQRTKADGRYVPSNRMTEDEMAQFLISIAGTKQTIKADGSVEISDMTEVDRKKIKYVRQSIAEKSEPER